MPLPLTGSPEISPITVTTAGAIVSTASMIVVYSIVVEISRLTGAGWLGSGSGAMVAVA
jgi:hypothetical protein